MGRPSRALLSREAIARAALEVVDESGADGLTMRALAHRLGVKAASLYNHVTGKDELLDALAGDAPEHAADLRRPDKVMHVRNHSHDASSHLTRGQDNGRLVT